MVVFDVELSLRARNISLDSETTGARASIQTILPGGTNFTEIAQTETVYNETNVYFRHRTHVLYRMDQVMQMQVIVYGVRDESGVFSGQLGRCQFDIPTLLVQATPLSLPLSHDSFLDVTLTVPDFYSHALRLQFAGSHLSSMSKLPLAPYLNVILVNQDRTILLHKSNVAEAEKHLEWNEFVLPLHIINHYSNAALQIHCYNRNVHARDTLIGYCSTSLAQLQKGPGAQNSYMLLNAEGVRIGEKTSIELTKFEVCTCKNIFDLLRTQGPSVLLTSAIDLTASNGNPTQPGSLHYIHPHSISPYEHVLMQTLPAILPFSKGRGMSALGFGAKVDENARGNYQLSQCFHLTGPGTKADFEIRDLPRLFDAYRSARIAVQPFAPTEFSEVIYHVSKYAKAESRLRTGVYFVLIIFTDGAPTDCKRTIDAIVDASPHPLSIIAVGVGKDRDFSGLKALESVHLKARDGQLLRRQNFQFVPESELGQNDAIPLISFHISSWNALQ